MASGLVFEHFTFTFQDPVGSEPGHVPSDHFISLVRYLASRPEVDPRGIYLGQYLEKPSTWLMLVPWVSIAKHREWMAMPEHLEFVKKVDSVVTNVVYYEMKMEPEACTELDAKCTELLTSYGVDDGYLASANEFLKRMGAYGMIGYYGGSSGKVLEPIAQGDEDKAPAVFMALGWESKEAHLVAKAKEGNPIIANLDLIRNGAKALVMYHAKFTKYTKSA